MEHLDVSNNHYYAAAIIFLISMFGLSCNLIVLLFMQTVPSLKNSFGSLTLSQALADCVHQAIFAFYLAPCIFLREQSLYSASHEMGFVLTILYEICGMSHVCISFNRFIAVYAPFAYCKMFSKSNTRLVITLLWTVAIVSNTYSLKIVDCPLYVPYGEWIFIFKESVICNRMKWYEFIRYVVYVAIVAILDFCSIIRIHFVNAKQRNIIEDEEFANRRKWQINLVYQVALQGIYFITELVTYFYLSPYARNKWEEFVLGTVMWCLVHAMDGFIVQGRTRISSLFIQPGLQSKD